MPRGPIHHLPGIFLCLGLGACGGSQAASPRTLQFVRFMPERTAGVFLNEPLTFHFSAEVDPLSVHQGSVVVETKAGERAHGSLRVEGKRIVFEPDVPRMRDLSDGGYRPGTQYLVHLEGFPRPDGIRGVAGEPLAATVQKSFDTVQVDEPRRALLFDDPHLERHKPPEIFPFAGPGGVYQIGVGDSIYLACEKPIDPTSIRSEDFSLRMGTSTGPVWRDVNLFVRLLENEPEAELRARPAGIHSLYSEEAWRSEKRAALIELTPDGPLEPNEIGNLRYVPAGGDEGWSMRDFSLMPLLPQPFAFRECKISVVAGASPASRELVEDFVDHDLRSPLTVPGSDGTASWEGDGRIGLHYPLAAGDGSAGSVALGPTQALGDLQAVEIDLEPGLSCRLPDEPGLVVLRAQGRITLRGKLERHAPPGQALDCAAERGRTLSDWLARAQTANPSWTILIAGGDIVITGKLETSVPMLLVAGGQIRAAGLESVPGIWTEAGAGGAHSPLLQQAEFLLDPPLAGHNPLKRPLRYAVVSVPLPANGRVARWISALASGGFEPPVSKPAAEHTASSWSVRYYCADDPQVPDFSKGFTSPVFLERPGAVRFIVELVLGDAPDSWQTPFVDRVQLSFERAPR